MIKERPWANAPPHHTSRMELTVRFCETDLMGVVHHGNYLTYFEAGRVDWLRKRGVRYEDWMSKGILLPVVEARIRYRRPARFDDLLVVESTCYRATPASVRFGCVILRGEECLCEGDLRLACVGPNLTPKRFPDEAWRLLRGDGEAPLPGR